jgi:hypothetical protein
MVAPIIYMADADLTLVVGAGTPVQYNGHVTTAEVVPTAGEIVATTTLDGVKHQRQGAPSFALHLVGHQDWTTTGLARFLWDNSGQLATFVLQAYGQGQVPSATMPALTGTVQLAEGSYGGEVDTYPVIDVTLVCAAKPTWKVAALADDQALGDTDTGTLADDQAQGDPEAPEAAA